MKLLEWIGKLGGLYKCCSRVPSFVKLMMLTCEGHIALKILRNSGGVFMDKDTVLLEELAGQEIAQISGGVDNIDFGFWHALESIYRVF